MSHTHKGKGVVEDLDNARAASRGRLWIALALIVAYMVAEAIGGFLAQSLTLLADAAHMLTDATALGLAILATWVASRPASARRTFGFQRTEVLAALLNALGLWVVAAWVFMEAYRRFQEPGQVQGALVLGIGALGMLVNVAAAWVLRRSVKASLNVEGAFLHVLGDLLGSIGVIGAGLLITFAAWAEADPAFGVIIGVLILLSSGRLLWKVLHVLMEGTPSHLDLQALCQQLEKVEGITGVHDIHAWSITGGYEVFSAHVTAHVSALSRPDRLLQRLHDIASNGFGIAHVTIQLEESSARCHESHHVAHDSGRLS